MILAADTICTRNAHKKLQLQERAGLPGIMQRTKNLKIVGRDLFYVQLICREIEFYKSRGIAPKEDVKALCKERQLNSSESRCLIAILKNMNLYE